MSEQKPIDHILSELEEEGRIFSRLVDACLDERPLPASCALASLLGSMEVYAIQISHDPEAALLEIREAMERGRIRARKSIASGALK